MAHASIVWLPDSGLSVLAHCEYPNGLALSPDERIMYVAKTRSFQYIQAIKLDAAGNMVGRTIFADLNEGPEPGTLMARTSIAWGGCIAPERAASG
jgi:sugar lactone lactonase YvrE